MRQIVLDIETTGPDVKTGNRVIEIAAIELNDNKLNGKIYHQYINPQRSSEPGALELHGLTEDFLEHQPLFMDMATEFLDFIDQAELIIHYAPFDVEFINNELGLLGLDHHAIDDCCRVIDTFAIAKEKFPGEMCSLGALCKKFGIDVEEGKYEGVVQDVVLISKIYMKMVKEER